MLYQLEYGQRFPVCGTAEFMHLSFCMYTLFRVDKQLNVEKRWRRQLGRRTCAPCFRSQYKLAQAWQDVLHPAAALGRMSPWHMKLRCLDLVAAFLLGVSTAVCTRHSPDASVFARFALPAWSSVRAGLLRLRSVFNFAPAHLPAADPVLHMSAPVRRGAVADARLGLA